MKLWNYHEWLILWDKKYKYLYNYYALRYYYFSNLLSTMDDTDDISKNEKLDIY